MMIRRTLPSAAALLLLIVAGCDSDGTITLVPEFEESFDFEAGLEGWTSRSGDLPDGTFVDVDHVTGPAAAGQGSVRITAAAQEAGGRVWIERPFEVTPEQSYEVTVSYALGTADEASTDPWDLVSAALGQPPTAGGLAARGSTAPESPDGTMVWELRDHALVVSSGEAAPGEETVTVWIALGLGVSSAGDRAYGLDEVQVSFLRN